MKRWLAFFAVSPGSLLLVSRGLNFGASGKYIPPVPAPAAGGAQAEPPAGGTSREVVLGCTPLYSEVPFEDRLPLLKAHPGGPLDRETMEKLRRLQSSEERER